MSISSTWVQENPKKWTYMYKMSLLVIWFFYLGTEMLLKLSKQENSDMITPSDYNVVKHKSADL